MNHAPRIMDWLESAWNGVCDWIASTWSEVWDRIVTLGGIVANLWDASGDWMTRNEPTTTLVLIWSLFLGYLALAIAKSDTWRVMRIQKDRTRVGRALKHQYIAEIFKNGGQAMLYGTVILLHYAAPATPVDIWERTGIRVVVVISLVMALVFNLALTHALRIEKRIARPQRLTSNPRRKMTGH